MDGHTFPSIKLSMELFVLLQLRRAVKRPGIDIRNLPRCSGVAKSATCAKVLMR
jgi:hypothetical protein